MAARGSRAGPNKGRKGGVGDNINEIKTAKEMLENIRLHKIKDSAFKGKQKESWEKNVVSKAKALGMTQADVMAFYEDHAIETGKDDDAIEKASRKRARRLNTYNRLYKSTHDGSQLDWVDLQKKDDEAIKAAEAEAGEAGEEVDGE